MLRAVSRSVPNFPPDCTAHWLRIADAAVMSGLGDDSPSVALLRLSEAGHPAVPFAIDADFLGSDGIRIGGFTDLVMLRASRPIPSAVRCTARIKMAAAVSMG